MIKEEDFFSSFYDFKIYVMNIDKSFYKEKVSFLEEEKKDVVEEFLLNNPNSITGKLLSLVKIIPKDIVSQELYSNKEKKKILPKVNEKNIFLNYVLSMINNKYV